MRTNSIPNCLIEDEIAGNDYDLSINGYKVGEYEAVGYDPPLVILERLAALAG